MRVAIFISSFCLTFILPAQARGDSNLYLDQAVMIICGEYSGAGFYFDETHVMTAKHVVEDCDSAKVINNSKKSTRAKISYRDQKEDIAILNTEQPVANSVKFDASEISFGKTVYIVGSPIDGLVLSKGKVVESDSFESPKRIYLEIAADHGNSGGPVFSEAGLVGMVTLKSDTQVIAYNYNAIKSSIDLSKNPDKQGNSDSIQGEQNSLLPGLQLSLIINLVLLIAVIFLGLRLRKNKRIEITLD